MALVLHVVIALASIGYTAYVFFAPTRNKLRVSQVLVVMTLASGTYLVLSTKVNLLRVCLMGLVYLGIVSWAIVSAQKNWPVK